MVAPYTLYDIGTPNGLKVNPTFVVPHVPCVSQTTDMLLPSAPGFNSSKQGSIMMHHCGMPG